MVFNGKPSAGCENCRKAKKKCDLELPTCGRCARLGKTCGGFRNPHDMLFRDQSASVSRRVRGDEVSSSTAGPSTQPVPDQETMVKTFFQQQFIAPGHFAFLEQIIWNDFLLRPVQACAMIVLANRGDQDPHMRETAREHYVAAIAATNQALRDPQLVREDNTLVAVFLLGTFERLDWVYHHSMRSLGSHIRGLGMVLQLRGRAQVRTTAGAALFRSMRSEIIEDALYSETAVDQYIVQLTQALDPDPIQTPGDKLAILAARVSVVRQSYRLGNIGDQQLLDLSEVLEQDLKRWRECNVSRSSPCSFRIVQNATGSTSWSGIRHEYRSPQSVRQWNLWRTLRVMLSRIQEAIWRRAWPVLQHPASGIPPPGHYPAIRTAIVDEICAAASCACGNVLITGSDVGSVSSGIIMVNPLALAATCLLEELSGVITSPGGNRLIFIDREYHHDPNNLASKRLAWIFRQLNHIADNLGILYGAGAFRFLTGNPPIHYDLARSNVTTDVLITGLSPDRRGLDLSTVPAYEFEF